MKIMFDQFQEKVNYRAKERQVINVLLTLATGVLTLIFPNFLYLIAGAYLISLGLMFMAFRLPSAMSALPLVTGILIFIFPELIPIMFAGFLGLFGLIMLFAVQLTVFGILTLIIAALIIMNPDSVAYLIAFFMLVYAVTNLMSYYKAWKSGKDDGFDDDSVTIE